MKSSRKLNIKDIFNKDSIAVFVDASVNVERNTVCSGAVIVDENFDTKSIPMLCYPKPLIIKVN